MLSDIRNCILATDLALFFGNKAKLKDIADKEELSWHEEEHRYDLFKHLLIYKCLIISLSVKFFTE